jgi:FixJ family two-component response regulator
MAASATVRAIEVAADVEGRVITVRGPKRPSWRKLSFSHPARTPRHPDEYNGTMLLVVDDDEDLLRMLDTLFARSGVPHVCASSLEQVRALGDVLPSLKTALLDINLGAGQPTGVDIAHWLREHGYVSRVIFITGHAPDHPMVKRAAGISDRILEKPIVPRQLLEIVRDGS